MASLTNFSEGLISISLSELSRRFFKGYRRMTRNIQEIFFGTGILISRDPKLVADGENEGQSAVGMPRPTLLSALRIGSECGRRFGAGASQMGGGTGDGWVAGLSIFTVGAWDLGRSAAGSGLRPESRCRQTCLANFRGSVLELPSQPARA